MDLNIQIILGSTREGRQGEKVARWFADFARKRDDMRTELIDLRDWPLPFFDEPKSPMTREYKSEVAQRWAEHVEKADGYVLITCEYNHGYPAVLKNALDYCYPQWNNKPVGLVSYSAGMLSGARAVEQLRLVAIELQMAPIREQVSIPAVSRAFKEDGSPVDERLDKQAQTMLDQLAWWARALKAARVEKARA